MGITAIAFDFGTKSIGCAVGQSITGTAQALPSHLKRKMGFQTGMLLRNA